MRVLQAYPGAPDIKVNWGTTQDIIKLTQNIKVIDKISHVKAILTPNNPSISFIYKNIRFVIRPMLDSGYEAVHISLFANQNFGAEIKIMTRNVYNYQKFGLGAHFLYKLKIDISKRAELVHNYRDNQRITRAEFFKKAQQIVTELGFNEAQQRGHRFLHYLSKNNIHGYSSPQNLYKTVGYIEQNYPWLYRILTEFNVPQMVKDPYFNL